MADSSNLDCSPLVSRHDFPSYIKTIRQVTANNLTLVSQCQSEVCNALWGSGNPDISGIGMMAGFVIESSLASILTQAVVILSHKRRKLQPNSDMVSSRWLFVIVRGYRMFFDCAVLFTLSIQIASTVVLARFDFGLDADDMGGCTTSITWAISVLTLLPLTCATFVPTLFRGREDLAMTGERSHAKESLRFNLFALCWLLSLYPFLSRMIETFGPSMIGGNEQVISKSDWAIISATCLEGAKAIGSRESTAMDCSSIAGWIFVSLLAITKIFWLALQRQHPNSAIVRYIRAKSSNNARYESWTLAVLLVVIPILTIGQLWTAFRWRSFQAQVSHASGNQDTDNQWTFGQIAAMTFFLPVAIELWVACSDEKANPKD